MREVKIMNNDHVILLYKKKTIKKRNAIDTEKQMLNSKDLVKLKVIEKRPLTDKN